MVLFSLMFFFSGGCQLFIQRNLVKDQEQSAAVRFNGGWQAISGVKECKDEACETFHRLINLAYLVHPEPPEQARRQSTPAAGSTDCPRGVFSPQKGRLNYVSPQLVKRAKPVKAAPKGTLIFALVFTAQPLASNSGPRLRRRKVKNAINMEGPEISNKTPRYHQWNLPP